MALWGIAATLLFCARVVTEGVKARKLNRSVVLRAFGGSLRFMLEGLGATFIKIGQIMSTRPDLLPPEIVTELVRLQEDVRPFKVKEARKIIEEDFGCKLEDLFEEFDPKPLAAASVAQVHRAKLKRNGDQVAIKIRRPSIALWADLDQSILLGIAHQLELIPSMKLVSPVESARQFCTAINRQLDFRIEANNNRRFRENFKDEHDVVFPALYDELCSERVLTMNFLRGYREREFAEAGIDPIKVAGLGIKVFCKMTFIDGFVHADLHPGNIRFLPDNRVALFDLGLTAELTEEDRLTFARTMFYMANGMGKELARHMYDLSEKRGEVNYAAYEAEIAVFVERFVNQPLGEVEMSLAIGKFLDIFRRYGMRLDGRFTVLNVSMMVVEGLGKKLNPALDITAESRPFLEAALLPLLQRSESA
jgi:ubiquinone biosynthesis protein